MLNWESVVTWQKSSNNNVLPLPSLNIYTNLFFKFNVANVLNIDLGADLRYFSKYYAHDYCPALSQFTVQENTEHRIELGNYPIVNVYANMDIKHTRFFFMMSHVNAGKGKQELLLCPPLPAQRKPDKIRNQLELLQLIKSIAQDNGSRKDDLTVSVFWHHLCNGKLR